MMVKSRAQVKTHLAKNLSRQKQVLEHNRPQRPELQARLQTRR